MCGAAAKQQQSQQQQQGCSPPADGQQQLDAEGIQGAFTPAAVLGIRTLPDALHPGYRQELLAQLQAAERARAVAAQQQGQQSHTRASGSGRQPAAAAAQVAAQGARAVAAVPDKVPPRYSPMEGYFSCYPHLTSEYGRSECMDKFARLSSKLTQVAADDFVVRGCPPPHPHSATFAHYSFDLPPFEEVDYLGRPQQQQQGLPQGKPFVPAGRGGSRDVLLRGQLPDVVRRLEAQLSRDWPRSFIKAFLNSAGAIVLSFDAASALHEGDLAAYCSQQEKHSSTIVEARLTKDPQRWGVVEPGSGSCFYVLLPPWCRAHKSPSSAAAAVGQH